MKGESVTQFPQSQMGRNLDSDEAAEEESAPLYESSISSATSARQRWKFKATYIVATCLTVAFVYGFLYYSRRGVRHHYNRYSAPALASEGKSTGTILPVTTGTTATSTATQGSVFKATKMRHHHIYSSTESNFDAIFEVETGNYLGVNQQYPTCDNWAVITTIFEPTKLINQLEDLPNWCLVIVGDEKSPVEYPVKSPKSTVYLSPDTQETLPYGIMDSLQWNHFGRKNIGYLFAIQQGAKVIYDTDDDNILKYGNIPLNYLEPTEDAYESTNKERHTAVNIYPLFFKQLSWPRGFPLHLVKENATVPVVESISTMANAQIIQSLANHDPDVDAMYRLTRPIPFDFDSIHGLKNLLMPQSGSLMPFNAQATLFKDKVMWGLMLPVTVHGRVSDIWRSYITQRILWDTEYRIAFTTPFVTQCRNAHDYLGDFQSEQPLYTMAGELVRVLAEWTPSAGSIPGRLVELHVMLFEMGYIEERDVDLIVAWIEDLIDIGYQFPTISPTVANTHKKMDDVDEIHHTASTCEKIAVDDDTCVAKDVVNMFYQQGAMSKHVKVPYFDYSRYKFLHVDAHKGPQVDSFVTFNTDYNIKPEMVSAVCAVNYCDLMKGLSNSFAKKPFEARQVMQGFISHTYREVKGYVHLPPHAISALDRYDVFVCSFPSWHCAKLYELGKVTIVRFSHIMWHGMSPIHVKAYLEVLDRMMKDPLAIVTSNNPYHYVAYKNVANKYPIPFPATYIHTRGKYLNNTYQPREADDKLVLLVGPHYGVPYGSRIHSALSKQGNHWNLVEFADIIEPDRRRMLSLVIFLPYAMHTAKINEFYALGVPMLFPSRQAITKLSRKNPHVLHHRNAWPFRKKNLTKASQGFCKNGFYDVNSVHWRRRSFSTNYWTQFTDFYNLPGIYYFDSYDEPQLVHTVHNIMADPTERHKRSDTMIKFFDELGRYGNNKSGRLEFTLHFQRALRHYDAKRH